MSKAIKITSMRCPDCGGTIEPAEGTAMTRCPYCNAVLHIEGVEEKVTDNQKAPTSSSKNHTAFCHNDTAQKFVAFTRFDYIVIFITVIGMIRTMWVTGNEIFMIIVALIGLIIVSMRMLIRGQIYRNKSRWQ